MRTTLIDYTGYPDRERAATLLMFTKGTRLGLDPQRLDEIAAMPAREKTKQLEYMASTIRSSWEFADLTFLVEDCTRAFAQQLTRTRTASFAMQSLRVVDAANIPVKNPYSALAQPDLHAEFARFSDEILRTYSWLVGMGSSREDARGILPLNTATSLVMKINLRNWVALVTARSSARVQGEYAEFVEQMRGSVQATWPWVETFLRPRHETALRLLQKVVDSGDLRVAEGAEWDIAKAADLIREGA